MFDSIKISVLLIMLVVFLPTRQLSAANDSTLSDVRILIDISGSMKKNDPNNLRSPALRLVVGLLPEGATSGVWTFGKYVNMLVPHRPVNDGWKDQAKTQSKKIHSYGLFTNIELVLNKASANQQGNDPRFRRSIILLSDGLVDISANKQTNDLSRERILKDIIPRLKKANIAVHTIALSQNADHELLRAISLATDGWYEQVDNAEQLQRTFLYLFEKAATRDTVPLLENNFKIDDSISEMTLLVFRRDGSKATQLLLPDQSRISFDTKLEQLKWHREDNYDLITIEQPLSGNWQIDADVDPDNRVMVITDLKLKTTDLPNNILIGETFDFESSLTQKGETIVREDFLKFVDAELKQESELADSISRSLNEQQTQGVYISHIGDNFQVGRNDVVMTFISPTFERQRRQSINVIDTPFVINVEQLLDRDTRTHRLTLIPDEALIKTQPLNIAALLTAQDGSEWSYEVMKNIDGNWQLTLADLNAGEDYSLALQIRGETLKGRSLFLQPEAIIFQDERISAELIELDESIVQLEDELTEQDTIEDEFSLGDEFELVDEMDSEFSDELAADEELNELQTMDESQGLSPAMKLIIGNTAILAFIGLAIFIWRRKRGANNNPGELL